MSRIITTESAGKERTQLIRAVVLALRELMQQDKVDAHTRDLAAFVGMALESVDESIERSVEAWEKRGYWVKADRFRMEWSWAGNLAKRMQAAVKAEDWGQVAVVAAQVAEKVKMVEVPRRHNLGTPWEGSWKKLLHGG